MGEFTLEGNPESGTLRFLDRFGHQVTAPELRDPGGTGPPDGRPPDGRPPDGDRPDGRPPDPPEQRPRRIFDPPLGERLTAHDFAWN